ncbi:MAG: pyridoxal phosphate-dependent aminotransferase [Trueperaceae bacterium]|nr:pyridoxal phosphate-dependent aminotransferase [Trueperaceae bacterium]
MQLSQRIQNVRASSTVAFNTKAADMRRQGIDVIAMTAGEPDFQPPEHVFMAAREALDLGLTKYTPAEGTHELRSAICDKHQRENGLEATPEQVIVSTGGKQVLYGAFQAILDPGDEVVVIAPYWVSYPAQIEVAGGVTVPVRTRAEDGFVPDPDEVAAAVTDRTKALVINSPSNPTGAVYPREVVEALVAVARDRGLWLIADDLYEHLIYEGTFTAAGPLYPEGTLTVHGASKAFALTGWRIGWGVGPQPLIKAMTRLQGQVTSGANALAQHATVAALTQVDATSAFLERTKAAYVERRGILVEGLNALGLATPMPHGAFYVMADVSALDNDEGKAALRLLEEAHVGVVPGTDFLAPGFVRFSYATSTDNVREALRRIEALLA